MADILIVDDDRSVATAFQHFLSFEGHECRLASSAVDALQLIDQRKPNLVMMDVRMPGTDGLQALEQIRAGFPDVYVVIMTAYGSSQTSIDAIRNGAFDYLTKPLDLDQLRAVIRKALAAQRTRTTGPADTELSQAASAVVLVGDSPAMLDVYKMIGRLATNKVPALVVGERGSGKQLVIATIHDNSPQRGQPLVLVDCTTVTETAFEHELFAPGTGTIQLAHVAALPPLLQSRLARALNERNRPAGSSPRIEARILASAEDDLAETVRAGHFSRELYDALAVITLEVPPLRSRREDIPGLVRYFIQRFNGELSRSIKGIDEQGIRQLQAHSWPGNVGELERVVKRACIVATSDVITTDDIGNLSESRFSQADVESVLSRSVRTALQERLVGPSEDDPSPFHAIVDLVETTLVQEALAITGGNQVKAAEILGVNRATLRKKMTPGSAGSGTSSDE
jgi:DNA-binding NtrC family response regulator